MAEQFIVTDEYHPCAACGKPTRHVGINAGGPLHTGCESWYNAEIGRNLAMLEVRDLTAQRDALHELVQILIPGALAVLPGGAYSPALIDAHLNRCRDLGIRL